MKIEATNARAYVLHLETLESMKTEDPAVTMHPNTFAKLRRLEAKAHRIAERQCNGYEDPKDDATIERILTKVRTIIGGPVPGLFFNADARGYALKVKQDATPNGMHTDWGRYGIIAPKF